ncbi:CAP domain-containing protein [bacterium]|nr:CAP domain-containing protein [bacterium]
MRISILLISLGMMVSTYATSLKDTIDPNNFDQTFFEKSMFDKVNSYRKSLYVNPLVFNEKIYEAAEDHCKYMMENNTLTHDQNVPGKKTVYDRVKKTTGVSKLAVAENVARSVVLMPAMNYDENGKASMKTAWTYEQAVEYLFNAWRQSDFHRKNMGSDKYVVSAIAIQFDPKSKAIHAVQVFARFGS